MKDLFARYRVPLLACGLALGIQLYAMFSLKWMLMPLAFLVSGMQGTALHDAGQAGYSDATGHLFISSDCAGINYLLLLFLLPVFYFLPGMTLRKQFRYMFLFLALSWIGTLGVNAARISVSISLLNYTRTWSGLMGSWAHEATGIVYFLLFLLLYFRFLRFYFTSTPTHENIQ
ncbi:MAG TPA: exosortase K [Bacteroidia bacterium]|jgi:exosortase K|nr:exosortase K [Bacteroidia bacterium]